MIKVRVLRDISDADLAEVRDLLDAVEAVDDHAALGEHKWLDLVTLGGAGVSAEGGGSGRCFAGIVAEEPPHPHPVGYAHLSANSGTPRTPGNSGTPPTPGNSGTPRTPGNSGTPRTPGNSGTPPAPGNSGTPPAPGTGGHFGLEVAVDPEHRGVGVEVALVEAALELAATEGGGQLHFWVFRPTQIHDALAHRLGFRRGRELYQMRRALPHPEAPRWPAGVRVRRFVPGQDEESWLAVNNAAFAGHPEQGAWDLETLRRREAEAWFDPIGFLMAEDADGLAGFCWTKVHEGNARGRGVPDLLGEIYVIAVDPSRQGTGLGRALVLGGLASLAERGCGTGMLYVDASNQPAVSLYRALGFDVHHIDRAYVADVPEAGDGEAGSC